jgi:hypothetical protein
MSAKSRSIVDHTYYTKTYVYFSNFYLYIGYIIYDTLSNVLSENLIGSLYPSIIIILYDFHVLYHYLYGYNLNQVI